MNGILPDVRVKKDWGYLGTTHYLITHINGRPEKIHYRVYDVTGVTTHAPSPDGPVVWLEVAGRYGFGVSPFLCITLAMFADRFKPVSKGDLFWEYNRETA